MGLVTDKGKSVSLMTQAYGSAMYEKATGIKHRVPAAHTVNEVENIYSRVKTQRLLLLCEYLDNRFT